MTGTGREVLQRSDRVGFALEPTPASRVQRIGDYVGLESLDRLLPNGRLSPAIVERLKQRMAAMLRRRFLNNGVRRQIEIATYAPLGSSKLIRLGVLISVHVTTLRAHPVPTPRLMPAQVLSKAVVTAHSYPRAPPRRARCDRSQARNIAAGDRTLRLRKGLRERITVSNQILL